MKITKTQLKRIIKEERAKLVNEQEGGLPGEIYDLERDINDFIIVIDRFFASAKVNKFLESAGLLDGPNSWALTLEELRYELEEIKNNMMSGRRIQ
tara:strand:- start:67 stop:354 length:288 start_codon:yes stop_codon:yes gene_type:complete